MNFEKKLCMGCMSEKNYEGNCKICNYAESTPHLPSYLAPNTILCDRYIAGKLISYNGEGAFYIGFDTVTERKVTIYEYMPDTICTRHKGEDFIDVNNGKTALYKTYMSDFLELHKTLMKSRGMTHLQTVLDIFQENNTAYVVFEYINGITLKTYLQNSAGELSWEQVKELFPPILTTLSLIHSAGIVHRGISPSTIIVTDEMQLKITGFCISATRTANSELAGELFAGYAAPEQYSSSEWHGTFTDVYGISAVFYRVLTGVMPPEAIGRLSNDNLIEPALINRNVPDNVSKVLISGLKLDPQARIRTITELVDKLFEKPRHIPIETVKKQENIISNIKSPKEKPSSNDKVNENKKIIIFLSVLAAVIVIFIISLIISRFLPDNNDSSSSFYDSTAYTEETQSTTQTEADTTPQVSEVTPTIYVPDFSNRQYYETVANFEGKLILTSKPEYNDTVPKDLIFEQSIKKGEIVPIKTEIIVKVSLGPSKVPLPDYKDTKADDYVEKLNDAKILFELVKVKSNDVPDGYVLKTSKDDSKPEDGIIKVDVKNSEKIKVYVAENFKEDNSSEESTSAEE